MTTKAWGSSSEDRSRRSVGEGRGEYNGCGTKGGGVQEEGLKGREYKDVWEMHVAGEEKSWGSRKGRRTLKQLMIHQHCQDVVLQHWSNKRKHVSMSVNVRRRRICIRVVFW